MLAIYVRISREKEDTDRSIEDQIQTGIELANKHRFAYEIYREKDGTSGSLPINQRPELERLVNDIIDGKITKVYAYDQSRLERSENTRYVLKRLFKESNIEVYYSNGKQGQSIEGDLAGDIISRVNQYYLEITEKKIESVLLRNAKEGRRFSAIQYGYKEGQDKKLEINEQEAELVKRIFALSLEGLGTSKIAEILNSEGIPTRYNLKKGTYFVKNKYTGEISIRNKKDVKWKGGTIRNIITNPIYKGLRRWGYDRKTKQWKHVFPAPAIFEEWYWEKVNNNLKNNSNNRGKAVEHSYLLKGLLRCGKCGANYYGRTRTAPEGKRPKDHYYMCSSKRRGEHNCGNRSINIDVLDGIIWVCLISQGRLQKLIHEFFNSSETAVKLKELEAKIESLNFELEQLNLQRRNVLKNLREIDISVEDMNEVLAELKEEIRVKTEEIKEIEIQFEDLSNSRTNIEQNLDLLSDLKDLNLEGKRELLKKFIRNVRINFNTEHKCYFFTIEFNVIGMENQVFVYMTGWKHAHTLETINPDGQTNLDLMIWDNDLDDKIRSLKKHQFKFEILNNSKEIYNQNYGQ